MKVANRWMLAMLAVVVALIGALALQLREDPRPAGDPTTPTPRSHRDADTAEALAGLRRRADLPQCPSGDDAAGPTPLRRVVVECAADGAPVQQGPPGEVTAQQLTDAIAGTSANTNAVQLLDTGTFTDPPSAADLMAVANKLNELIQAMRR